LWILFTAAPYLPLDTPMVLNGERYFYLPHIGLGIIAFGCWLHFKKIVPAYKNLWARIIIVLIITFALFVYGAGSIYAIRQRIDAWIDAGNISRAFLETFKSKFPEIRDNTAFIIKDIPRWRNNPPRLIVLITGATFAARLQYNKPNIEIIPYWRDFYEENSNFLPKKKEFDNYIFLEYKNGLLSDWTPPPEYLSILAEHFVNIQDFIPKKED